jgi:hypothetical protein
VDIAAGAEVILTTDPAFKDKGTAEKARVCLWGRGLGWWCEGASRREGGCHTRIPTTHTKNERTRTHIR